MSYLFLRSLLFRLDPETAHNVALQSLRLIRPLGLPRLLNGSMPRLERHLMGLTFPNPLGLAAGLDKNGDYIDALAALGFGFLEVGTVTPRPQTGNPQPRMFRLPKAGALINRMGFNNKGVDHLVGRLQGARYKGIIGVNIGKNADTPLQSAIEDYLVCIQRVYPYASYITVNLSSPNTPGLRDLQHGGLLDELLAAVKAEQMRQTVALSRYVPLVIKIAPDMSDEQLVGMADALKRHRVDAVAAVNTTLARSAVQGLAHADESGGLSGRPLLDRSNHVIALLSEHLQGALPIIGIGGIFNGTDAAMKLRSGASLVQVYTGLIYRGPSLIRDAVLAMQSMDEPARMVPVHS